MIVKYWDVWFDAFRVADCMALEIVGMLTVKVIRISVYFRPYAPGGYQKFSGGSKKCIALL